MVGIIYTGITTSMFTGHLPLLPCLCIFITTFVSPVKAFTICLFASLIVGVGESLSVGYEKEEKLYSLQVLVSV